MIFKIHPQRIRSVLEIRRSEKTASRLIMEQNHLKELPLSLDFILSSLEDPTSEESSGKLGLLRYHSITSSRLQILLLYERLSTNYFDWEWAEWRGMKFNFEWWIFPNHCSYSLEVRLMRENDGSLGSYGLTWN